MSRERLNGRVARLEQGGKPNMPMPWMQELADLERDYELMFHGTPDDWSETVIDDYLAYVASPIAGRLDELRQMAKTPEQRAQDAAAAAEIDAMSAAEIDAYLAGYRPPSPENST